jgi:hypothetical protein
MYEIAGKTGKGLCLDPKFLKKDFEDNFVTMESPTRPWHFCFCTAATRFSQSRVTHWLLREGGVSDIAQEV